MKSATRSLKLTHEALGLLLLVGAWEIAAQSLSNPALTPFTEVATSLTSHLPSLMLDTLVSLRTVAIGVVIACAFGNVLGVLASQYKLLERLTFAIADATRNVSAIALLPAFIVTLGIGIAPKIVVIFWTAYPAALITALHAMRSIPNELTEAASLDGASPWQVMLHIKLPLALAGIVSGWRIALSGGWISLVAAEMLGSNRGLGYAVLISSQTFRFERMYATIIVIALLGYAMSKVLEHLAYQLERNT